MCRSGGIQGMSKSDATDLNQLLKLLDLDELTKLLDNNISQLAVGKWAWLADLQRAGCKPAEIAELIYEGTHDTPWIYFEPSVPPSMALKVGTHSEACSHFLEDRIRALQLGTKGGPISGSTYAEKAIEALLNNEKMQASVPSEMTETNSFVRETKQAGESARLYESMQRLIIGPIALSQAIQVPTDYGTIQRLVEELCGIGGIAPSSRDRSSWHGNVTFRDSSSVATCIISYDLPKAGNPAAQLLHGLSSIAERLSTAIAILQNSAFCCDSFTLLAADQQRTKRSVLNLIRIEFSELYDFIADIASIAKSGLNADSIDLWSAAPILVKIWPELDPWSFTTYNREREIHLYSLILQVLCVGVLSYFQSHIGKLRPFFLDTALQQIHLRGTGRDEFSVMATQENLTCLSGMTGNNVIAFFFRTNESLGITGPFDIRASPEDLLDTWGPGGLVCRPENVPIAIKLGGGYIHASGHTEHSEELYHWARNWNSSETSKNSGLALKERILIGSNVRHYTKCQNNSSQALQNSSNQLEPLGPHASYLEVAEYQIGAQGGPESFNFIATQTRVKRPGRTMKDDLLEQPQKLLENLNSYLAVRVSLCTGVSQRVPLRALFGDLFPAYMSTISSQETRSMWEELQANHRLCDRLINAYASEGEPSLLRNWLLSLNREQLTFIFGAMDQMLKTLRYTGLSPNGNLFSVACPQDAFSRCFEVPIEEETKWMSLLADSQKCATFAYVTTTCLVTDEVSCQSPCSWTNNMPFLETSVLVPMAKQPSLCPGGFYFFIDLDNGMNWVEARQRTDGGEPCNTLVTVHHVTAAALSWRVRITGKSWGNRIRERRDHWETALAVSILSTRNKLRRLQG